MVRPSLKELVRLWQEEGRRFPEDQIYYYTIYDLYPYREYTWTRNIGRDSLEDWVSLKKSLWAEGWKDSSPLYLMIGKNDVKVGEGNHRLGALIEFFQENEDPNTWNKADWSRIPVSISYRDEVYREEDQGARFKTRENRSQYYKQLQKEEQVKKQKKQKEEQERHRQYEERRKNMSPEERAQSDAQVNEIMDLLSELGVRSMVNDKLQKKAEMVGLQGTTALKSVQDLGTRVKALLDELAPTLQGSPALTKLNDSLQKIQQLEQQVASLEQANAKIQQSLQQNSQPSQPQSADDQEANDKWKLWLGKAWKGVEDLFGANQKWEQPTDNSVAGVRGEVEDIPGVIKEAKDSLPGGKGDKTPERLLSKRQLEMGKKVEMEHTDKPSVAKEITKDHLTEQLDEGKDKDEQDYYDKLKEIHTDECGDAPAFWRKNLDYGSR